MSSLQFGRLLVVGFVLAQAFRDVYLGGVFQTQHLAVIMCLVSALAPVFFGVLWLAESRGGIHISAATFRDLIWVNLSTAAAWLAYFYALQKLEPASVNLLHEGTIPICAFVLTIAGVAPAERAVRLKEGPFYLGIAVSLGLMAWVVFSGRSGFTRLDPGDSYLMIVSAILSGVFVVVSFISARRLNEAGMSATGVMAVRFFALIFVAGAIAYYDDAAVGLDTIPIAVTCGFLILGPIYALQLAIARVPAITVGVLTSLGPVVIFALQIFEGRVLVSGWTLASIAIYSAFSVGANLVRAREDAGL